jgi:hypothetical protein
MWEATVTLARWEESALDRCLIARPGTGACDTGALFDDAGANRGGARHEEQDR